MINTYNETHLHRTIKNIYSMQKEGSQTEQKLGPYICDILGPGKEVVEIQTGSLGHLKKKIDYLLDLKYKVTVVFPLPAVKYIETIKKQTLEKTRRKSPVSKNIYKGLFRELTGLYPVLLDRRFTLEVLEITYTEERSGNEQPEQSKNGRRRHLKSWNKCGKRLESIDGRKVFHGKKSYLSLLPENLEKEFTVTELFEALKENKIKTTRQDCSLLCWLLTKMELIEQKGMKGRAKVFGLK